MPNMSRLVSFSIALVFLTITVQGQAPRNGEGFRCGNELGPQHRELVPGQRELMTSIQSLMSEQPTEILIQFFTAMSNPEAQRILKQLKVEPAAVEEILRKLKGNAQEVSEAKQSIKTAVSNVRLEQLGKKEWQSIAQLAKIYQTQQSRETLRKRFVEDSTASLVAGLTALSNLERFVWFRGILFRDLLETVQTKGEPGRKEVVEKLSRWLDSADLQSITKASMIYSMAAKSAGTTTAPPSSQSSTPSNRQTLPSSTASSSTKQSTPSGARPIPE